MRATLLALTLLAIAAPVGADHCTTYSTSEPQLTIPLEAAGKNTHYYDRDCYGPSCYPFLGNAMWIYEETNGIPGLQRGDEINDDTCHGMIVADTIVV